MTKPKTAAVVALAIVVIMVLSSLIVLVGSGIDDGSGGGEVPDPSGSDPSTTPATFTGDGVTVRVVDLFPQLDLVGTTSEHSIDRLDAELAQIQGIRGLDSGYADFGTYRASVSLAPGTDPLAFYRAVVEDTSLQNVQASTFGLVAVPEGVVLKSADGSEDRNFSPPSSLQQARLSVLTQKGDEVTAAVSAQYAGDLLLDFDIIELYNPASAPQTDAVGTNFEIAAFLPELWAQGTVAEEAFADKDALSDALFDAGFSPTNVFMEPLGSTVRFSVLRDLSGADENALRRELEFAFLGEDAVTEFFFVPRDGNGLGVVASLGPDANAAYVSALLSGALGSVFDANAFVREPPRVAFSATVEAPVDDRNAAVARAADLNAFFAGAREFTLYQKARFDRNELYVPTTEATYAIPGASFEGWVRPVHAVGTDVVLEFVFTRAREEIIQVVSAVETQRDLGEGIPEGAPDIGAP